MQEHEMVGLMEQVIVTWNRGDFDAMLGLITEDFVWDCTHSAVPGLTEVYRGYDGYMQFVDTWRGTLGPTRLELQEARGLDDGRLFVVMRQTATGPQSGAEVETSFAQIVEFRDGQSNRSLLFGDPDEGRRAAGLA